MTQYSNELIKILKISELESINLNQSFVGTEHFILGLLKSNCDMRRLFNSSNIYYEDFYNKVVSLNGNTMMIKHSLTYSPLMKRIIMNVNKTTITTEDIVLSMIEESEGIALNILDTMKLDLNTFYKTIKSGSINNAYGINLNELAIKNMLNPVIGRDKEINSVIEILSKKNKCNPLLIGDAGVGKTAIAEGLAIKIVNEDVPKAIKNMNIISISLSSIISGTKYRGEFEEKLNNMISYFENSNNILFIDEIHTLVGAGGAEGAIDASNILKPYLARSSIKCIGATTKEEYNKSICRDKALNRRFETIIINETNFNETKEILHKLKSKYEKFHNVSISNKQLDYIASMARKKILNKKDPDRSIDILDEVCVKTKLYSSDIMKNKYKVELNDIIMQKKLCLTSNNFEVAALYKTKEEALKKKINSYRPSVKSETINAVIDSKINTIYSKIGFTS